MKKSYIVLLLLWGCSFAESPKHSSVQLLDSGFSLHQDTISFQVKGEMTHALRFHDKHYVLYEQKLRKYGGYGKRWLYVFSNGKVENVIDCPKELNTVNLDFYVKNDSLIIKPYMEKQSYYLDSVNYSWIKLDRTDDLIFEDDSYMVYSLDFGEWGGKTWFRDKLSGQEYILESTTPLVNRIGTIYYLTTAQKILKIVDPKLLTPAHNDITYRNIKSTGKAYSWYSKATGFEIVYHDSAFNYFDDSYNSLIVSSFVLNNKLLHIYVTDTGSFITSAENGSMTLIDKIFNDIDFVHQHYSYRCRNIYGNNELLKFRTNVDQMDGLLEIRGSEIHITYLVNGTLMEPQLYGRNKADSILDKRLDMAVPHLRTLSLGEVDKNEQSWESFDITPNHKIGVAEYWNPLNFVLDTIKSYIIIEDSLISNSIIYYANKESDLVRTITMDWEKARSPRDDPRAFIAQREISRQAFLDRFQSLESFFTGKLGQPINVTVGTEEKYASSIWKVPNGVTVELSGMSQENYNNIRVVLYLSEL
ncbi:MAG: hypothetical protein KF905_05480 [Flavobacteriales bacterium]|nr:hypothetical protein [Flavobacteriales bacterium]